MSSIPGSPSLLVGRQSVLAPAGPQVQAPAGDHPAPVAGRGSLEGRQVGVGDGAAREATVGAAQKVKQFFGGLGLVVAGAALVVTFPISLAAAKLGSWLKGRELAQSEGAMKAAPTPALTALSAAPAGGLLDAQALGHQRDAIVGKLMAHAQATGKSIPEEDLQAWVNTGEHIARALQGEGGDRHPLQITLNGQTHDVRSSAYNARALGWYMMAQAAAQDVSREAKGQTLSGPGGASDMTTSGSFVMKDPGNRLYNFLNQCPTAGKRMSTHFADRIGHEDKHRVGGFFQTSKPAQRGIEDFRSLMPGKGGTLLFDKLRPDGQGTEELFVKFESGGCPPYFSSGGVSGFFAALDRNIGHAVSFLSSRSASAGAAQEVQRQEHVHKGVLKSSIGSDFSALVREGLARGVPDSNVQGPPLGSVKAMGKSVHKFGLPFIKGAVALYEADALQKYDLAVASGDARAQTSYGQLMASCKALSEMIRAEEDRLGLESDRHGIERRGAEVHISLASAAAAGQ